MMDYRIFLQAALASSLILSQAPTASAGVTDLPYFSAKCGTSLTQPKGGGDAFFSRDCQTAFVLPPKFGKAEVDQIAPGGNVLRCSGYNESMRSTNDYQALLKANAELIAKLRAKNALDPKIDQLLAQNRAIATDVASMGKEYRKLPAATAQVLLDAGFTDDWMNEWQIANKQLVDLTHVVIKPAPITQALLSFGELSYADSDKELDPLVLKSTIKGFRKSTDERDNSVFALGTSSGQIVLSMAGACPLVTNPDSMRIPADARFNKNQVLAHLAPNYSYSVPFLNSTRITASLNIDNALAAMTSQASHAGQFTLDQVLKTDLAGSASEVCKVQFNRDTTGDLDKAQQDIFEANAKKDLCKDFLTRLTEKMKQVGIVDQIPNFVGQSLPSAAGGNVAETRVRRECHKESSWIVLSHTVCSDVTYTVPKWVDGNNTKELFVRDMSSFGFKNVIEMNQPVDQWRTSTFASQEEGK